MEIKKCGWFLKKYVEANLCLWGLINTWWISRGGSNSEEESPRVHVERRKGETCLCPCALSCAFYIVITWWHCYCYCYCTKSLLLLLLLFLHQINSYLIFFLPLNIFVMEFHLWASILLKYKCFTLVTLMEIWTVMEKVQIWEN